MSSIRIGVDVGGTFADLISVDEESGRITVDKVPSTPDDPARGVVEGVRRLCMQTLDNGRPRQRQTYRGLGRRYYL